MISIIWMKQVCIMGIILIDIKCVLGCLTVHKPSKVIVARGTRQVGLAILVEKGEY